jgi:hypothetical protein
MGLEIPTLLKTAFIWPQVALKAFRALKQPLDTCPEFSKAPGRMPSPKSKLPLPCTF